MTKGRSESDTNQTARPAPSWSTRSLATKSHHRTSEQPWKEITNYCLPVQTVPRRHNIFSLLVRQRIPRLRTTGTLDREPIVDASAFSSAAITTAGINPDVKPRNPQARTRIKLGVRSTPTLRHPPRRRSFTLGNPAHSMQIRRRGWARPTCRQLIPMPRVLRSEGDTNPWMESQLSLVQLGEMFPVGAGR